jgi:hypothetical protein
MLAIFVSYAIVSPVASATLNNNQRQHDNEIGKTETRRGDFCPQTGKAGVMTRNLFLSLALLALLGFAIAITSGKLGGPSDLEMRVRASEPFAR